MKLTDSNKIWRVTTEGDIEGRTIVDFGYFRGNIIDIAKKLAGAASWKLSFQEFSVGDKYPNTSRVPLEFHISVNGMNKASLLSTLKQEGYIEASQSNLYESVKITIDKDEVNKLKREMALSKLSDEEKELLGL